jgi:predicted GNAT superfamily acetyltransferase
VQRSRNGHDTQAYYFGARMTSQISICELHQMHEFEEALTLQQTVWHMTPGDCILPHIMKAASLYGGVVIGAKHHGQLIGFCFGFAARRGDSWLLWSFVTGVLPDYQGQGIGYRLKQAQRTWARENGYALIGWTFDPLQRGNANFNFNRLAVTVRSYYADFYGQMNDGINSGLASDRFEALWDISDTHANENNRAENAPPVFLVQTDDCETISQAAAPSWDAVTYAVEIPYDIGALKQNDLDRAIQWQLAFRDTVQQALAAGYIVSGFVVQPPRCWYVLRRQ